MNKNVIKSVIIGVILLALIIGYYFHLSAKNTKSVQDEVIETTLTQDVLAKDLQNAYPASPKEVMKYYNEIQECYYNEENDEETIKKIMLKSRELFDKDLLAKNDEDTQFQDLMGEIKKFREEERDIFAWSTDSANDVEYNTFEESDWATIRSHYTIRSNSVYTKTTEVFLMRKDAEGKWKIYGWDLEQSKEAGE